MTGKYNHAGEPEQKSDTYSECNCTTYNLTVAKFSIFRWDAFLLYFIILSKKKYSLN